MQDVLGWCEDVFDDPALRLLMRVVMVLFGLAAIVHVLNMLSQSGYRWADGDMVPRIFDIVFAALFVITVCAVVMRNAWAVPLWLTTALLQIALFKTMPASFAGTGTGMTAPQTMIATHSIFILAFAVLLIARRFR